MLRLRGMGSAVEQVNLDVDLDRNSVKPLYLQIYERLHSKITAFEWAPGYQVPPELELARAYGVGRVTVRRALDELVKDRLLLRQRAKGTFVAQRKLERELVDVESFTARMEALGLEAGARLLSVKTEPVTKAMATRLQVTPDSPVIRITRLRLSAGEPVGIETSTVSLEEFPGLDDNEFEGASLYAILRDAYGVHPERSTKTLEITTATHAEAGHLGVVTGAALFLLTATVYQGDRPIEHVKTLLNGSRFRFRIGRSLAR